MIHNHTFLNRNLKPIELYLNIKNMKHKTALRFTPLTNLTVNFRHIVLGIYWNGRFGALGLSRRDNLMYKELKFEVFSFFSS